MTKKIMALSAGAVMVAMGIVPVLAVSDTENASTFVDVNANMTLDFETAPCEPYGSTGSATDLTPTSSTVSTKADGTSCVLEMTTNSADGGTISAQGNDAGGTTETAGTLYNVTTDDTIPNSQAGASLAVSCVGSLATNDDFTGIAIRAVAGGSDTAGNGYVFDEGGGTSLATKYGDTSDDTNTLWCHPDATDRQMAQTTAYNSVEQSLEVDFYVGVKADQVSTAEYTEVIVFTATPR